MPTTMWNAPMGPPKAGASVAQNTFTAARDIPVGEDTTSLYVVPGNTLNAGSQISVEAWGVMSNTATPTIILGIYWGGVAGTALAISTAKTTTTAMTNWEWHINWIGRCTGTGTTGAIIGSGYWFLPTSLTAWTAIRFPETAPASVAVDTTIDKKVSIGATWSASSISNTITCHQMAVVVGG